MAALDPGVVDTLMDRLSGDDAFRALYAADPHAALREAGHQGDDVPCMAVTSLASKEAIAAARDELRNTLLSVLENIPHRLEA
jgi:putative modified peptide